MVRRDPEATRRELLEAAFEEMYMHGFQGTGLEQILERTGVTKGALYHHFESKQELGYAVLEEVIRPLMLSRWMDGLGRTEDPLTSLRDLMYSAMGKAGEAVLNCGCPLNNLTQEMSQLDEGFRRRIATLLVEWRQGVAEALRRGIEVGNVRSDIDAESTAAFLIAGWEGMAGMAKGTRDVELLHGMAKVMENFLESLRPAGVTAGIPAGV